MDIRELSPYDLLHNTEDRDPSTTHPIDRWLTMQGIYPGTARIPASHLYNDYVKWHQADPPQDVGMFSITKWGTAMSIRFKRGKGKGGRFYYVSHETAQEVLEKLGG